LSKIIHELKVFGSLATKKELAKPRFEYDEAVEEARALAGSIANQISWMRNDRCYGSLPENEAQGGQS